MYIIEIILLSYFGYVSMYSFFLGTAGLFYRNLSPPEARRLRRVAVLIPAYKEDQVITGVAEQALEQSYPSDFFDVVVIADSLKPITLQRLRALPIKVIEVSFEKSTKVKALNRAMQVLGDDYDCALVLDADNVMERDFIRRMNNLFEVGYRAVQARRDPKNENTSMALLDGLSETINNFIYRQGNVALGWSASLNGSGMMFDYAVFKETMGQMDSIGGFDRELELRLLEHGIKVYFARNVIVFDEKVASQQVFEHQRKRWISSHFYYLRKYFKEGWRRFFKGDTAYFNSSVLRNIQLPRLLNLGLLSLTIFLSFIFAPFLSISPWIWVLLLGLNVLAMVFAIPRRFYNWKLLKSIVLIPRLFVKMFLLLFKLKGANKSFIHTPHGRVEMNIEKETAN
ncbi:MAG TPA: glycosyltransferase family 2 protein [Chryseosolibacter sp.]|nr:glycosyltransferase family 2 protein [Chryseosolibacter sp.]